MGWKKVGGQFPIYDLSGEATPGTETVAKYLGKKENQGQNANSTIYHLEIDGKEYSAWGSAFLDILMENVKAEDTVKIVFKGMKKLDKGRNPAKDWEVYVDDGSNEDESVKKAEIPF